MNTNVALSFELICLINWLLNNEKSALNGLVKHAVKHGFTQELESLSSIEYSDKQADHLYGTVVEFLAFLETSLLKNLETIQLDAPTSDAILPTIKKMDLENVDLKTLLLSMQQTKAVLLKQDPQNAQKTPGDSATAILFEKLLKNWKPQLKEPLH